jgi:hypothetical protein
MSIELVSAFAIGVLLLASCVAFGLWISRRTYRLREVRVRRINFAFRTVAERRGDTFTPGGTHDHPIVGGIEYAGRVRGLRGPRVFTVTFREGGSDDPDVLSITVSSIRMRKRKLTRNANGLSPEAHALVLELLDAGHEVCLERNSSSVERDINDLIVTLNDRREDPLEPDTLDELTRRALALAEALERSQKEASPPGDRH